jgi:hypothetical protein
METAVVVMMLSTGLGAMLLPLLIVLFGFSKPQSRRTPVFFFVFLSIIFGLIDAVWMNIVTVSVPGLCRSACILTHVA